MSATPLSRCSAPAKSQNSFRAAAACFNFPACGRSFATSSFFSATILSRIFIRERLLLVRHALLPGARLARLKPRTDKRMDVTVHHALHITGLVARAQVFY